MQLIHISIQAKRIGLESVMLPKFWCSLTLGCLMLKKITWLF